MKESTIILTYLVIPTITLIYATIMLLNKWQKTKTKYTKIYRELEVRELIAYWHCENGLKAPFFAWRILAKEIAARKYALSRKDMVAFFQTCAYDDILLDILKGFTNCPTQRKRFDKSILQELEHAIAHSNRKSDRDLTKYICTTLQKLDGWGSK